MLELMSYGLTGLATVVVIAFCFAFSEEFSLVSEKHLIETKDKAHQPLSRRSGEKRIGTLYGGVTDQCVWGEAFHG
jgi:hypothetical protein